MTGASIEDLDRELTAQAAISQDVLAAAQTRMEALAAETRQIRLELEDRTAELAGVRTELARARAELQWLRRLHIDLVAIMEHPALRPPRAAGRRARAILRRTPREA